MLAVYKPFFISLKTYKNQDWKSRMNASELRILTQEICYYARNMLLRMISLSMRTVVWSASLSIDLSKRSVRCCFRSLFSNSVF